MFCVYFGFPMSISHIRILWVCYISRKISPIWPIERTLFRCYHSWPELTKEQWQCWDTPHFLKLQYYWSFTIRFVSVIPNTLLGGVLPPLQKCNRYIWQLQPTGSSLEESYPPFRAAVGILQSQPTGAVNWKNKSTE